MFIDCSTANWVLALWINASGKVLPISPISNIAVYTWVLRTTALSPNPDLNTFDVTYNFNQYFGIPGKQSFVVSKWDGPSYNGPYSRKMVQMHCVLLQEHMGHLEYIAVLIQILQHEFLQVHITHLPWVLRVIHLDISSPLVPDEMPRFLLVADDLMVLKPEDSIPMIHHIKLHHHGKEFFRYLRIIQSISIVDWIQFSTTGNCMRMKGCNRYYNSYE